MDADNDPGLPAEIKSLMRTHGDRQQPERNKVSRPPENSERARVRTWAGLGVFLLLSILMVLASRTGALAQTPPTFVGAAVCAGCHAAEADRWKGSHHALAMQKATPTTVLGDFADARFEQSGIASTFSHVDGHFQVHTDGPDGELHDFGIAYTFGVYPLQQYLIAMQGGRLQALGIAWDSRTKAQGGQRWMSLYPGQKLPAGDRLHWTGRDQTWNYMCADCHSTGLRKSYDLTTNSYATTWSDVDVSCEACHGPGARHVAWVKSGTPAASTSPPMGLEVWLKPTDTGTWEMNPATGIARRTQPLVSRELDACAGCHSRRKVIAGAPVPGAPLLDSYLPALLEPGLYHADGQIDGEVFEYGSFIQSRMFTAGVTCSNCHEPHALTLRAPGNALCAQCHMPEKFDTTEHTHHQVGSAGTRCVNCHMPTKTYMIVDARRDHSFRVPRPDLSVRIGVPNTCNACHGDKSAIWAAEKVAAWFPHGRQTTPHYATALYAGRIGAVDAERQLDALIRDGSQPAIARATALLELRQVITPASGDAIEAAIADANPLVRAVVPRALPATLPAHVVERVAPLLADPVRAVRVETARALVGVDPTTLTPQQRDALDAAYRELVVAENVDADRPESHLNLGLLDLRLRLPTQAEAEYQIALRLDPQFVPAMVNLADLDRMRGQDQQGEDELRKALQIEPNNADTRYSLGLLLVRKRDYVAALDQLRQANALAPDNARYSYVYAVALNGTGETAQATALLEHTYQQHPTDRDVLVALISMARARGDVASALARARALAKLYPADPQVRVMVIELERQQAQ
jgi:predicted CXXCH cytochrome family protein